MSQRLVSLVVSLLVGLCLMGCGSKKVVVRNCEKAGNADVFVCDSL